MKQSFIRVNLPIFVQTERTVLFTLSIEALKAGVVEGMTAHKVHRGQLQWVRASGALGRLENVRFISDILNLNSNLVALISVRFNLPFIFFDLLLFSADPAHQVVAYYTQCHLTVLRQNLHHHQRRQQLPPLNF